jgi:hypothetical protein
MNEYQAGRDRVLEELEKEFSIINICDAMDWIYFTFHPNGKQGYNWETERLAEFCKNFGVFLYERTSDVFSAQQGVLEAEARGYRKVILSEIPKK